MVKQVVRGEGRDLLRDPWLYSKLYGVGGNPWKDPVVENRSPERGWNLVENPMGGRVGPVGKMEHAEGSGGMWVP